CPRRRTSPSVGRAPVWPGTIHVPIQARNAARQTGRYGSRSHALRPPCLHGQRPPRSSPGCGSLGGRTSSAPCLANADVTAMVPDAMSKVTGAEAKVSVHPASSMAAMILDMMFLFTMVDKETADYRPLRHLAPAQQPACQSARALPDQVKTTENQRRRFSGRAIVCGANRPIGCQHAAVGLIWVNATCSELFSHSALTVTQTALGQRTKN